MLEIQVKERDTKKKPDALRESGVLPAVFYGPKEETTPVELNAKDFEKVWKETGGSAIVVLKGVGDDKEALIHEVDVHPVHGNPQHADLYVIERGKKISVEIPLEFVGEAPAERAGHTIVKVMHEVEIEVRPAELPQNFEIDISKMREIGDHISVKDIKLPESGEFVTDPEETIVSVKETIEEVEPIVEEVAEEGAEAPAEGVEKEPADDATGEEEIKA
jgi:large subunit ribosomal protein L25